MNKLISTRGVGVALFGLAIHFSGCAGSGSSFNSSSSKSSAATQTALQDQVLSIQLSQVESLSQSGGSGAQPGANGGGGAVSASAAASSSSASAVNPPPIDSQSINGLGTIDAQVPTSSSLVINIGIDSDSCMDKALQAYNEGRALSIEGNGTYQPSSPNDPAQPIPLPVGLALPIANAASPISAMAPVPPISRYVVNLTTATKCTLGASGTPADNVRIQFANVNSVSQAQLSNLACVQPAPIANSNASNRASDVCSPNEQETVIQGLGIITFLSPLDPPPAPSPVSPAPVKTGNVANAGVVDPVLGQNPIVLSNQISIQFSEAIDSGDCAAKALAAKQNNEALVISGRANQSNQVACPAIAGVKCSSPQILQLESISSCELVSGGSPIAN